ncbi:MAG TPA: hypothetical protein VJH87_06630 [Vicinamibacteria bacterium]|nr:hypothetical protein [Vicinamibacteria bacterium]
MKRAALNYLVYLLLLVPALTLLFSLSRPREEVYWISLAAAIITYFVITNSPLRWAVPRRSRDVPSIFICFLGALLVSLATGDPTGGTNAATWLAALAAAFAFLFAAVKTGVPTHVGILMNTESVSAHWNNGVPDVARGARVAERMRHLFLFYDPEFVSGNFGVWPEHFEISPEGSIAWYVRGRPKTRATIRFDQGFDPFSEPGGAPSEFVVPPPGCRGKSSW